MIRDRGAGRKKKKESPKRILVLDCERHHVHTAISKRARVLYALAGVWGFMRFFS